MDERESGVRAILNFGHTLGHALETVSGYGTWLHGEAVAAGMVFAGAVSVHEREFSEADQGRLVEVLSALGLPTDLGALPGAVSWEQVRAAMASDKKTRGRIPRFVLAEKPGSVAFGCEVGDGVLADVFHRLRVPAAESPGAAEGD